MGQNEMQHVPTRFDRRFFVYRVRPNSILTRFQKNVFYYLYAGGLMDHLPLLHPCQGPLFDLPKLIPQCIRFDSMHVLCLGVDLLVAGNVMKALLQYDFWGDGDDSQKLLAGWQRFKQWARTKGWQPLASQFW